LIKFAAEWYLYLLLLIPLLVVLYILYLIWRKKAVKLFGDWTIVQKLTNGFSLKRMHLKFILSSLAVLFLIIGLANPQMGTRLEKIKRKGVDVVIALDVSKSMMAEDITPSRLERSKQLISKLLSRMSDDRVALVVFAGNAYLQMPLTIDYSAAKLFLETINTEIVPTQGTAIALAVDLAEECFDEEQEKFKTLIIITDGENHEQGPIDAAESARENGILTYTVGVGTKEGAPIPVYKNGRRVNYVKDASNNPVLSKLNTSMLKDIAKAGDGKFFQLTNGTNEITNILDELSQMDKREFEDRVFTDFEDQFQWFIGIGLLLLMFNFLLPENVGLSVER